MVARAWRRCDAGLARCALPAVALCTGDVCSTAIAGAAALASVVPQQWQWAAALVLATTTSSVVSLNLPALVAVFSAILLATLFIQFQQRWLELRVGADEGVILIQALLLGAWKGALAASGAQPPPFPQDLDLPRHDAAVYTAVALLVGGTCATWTLSLPVLWAHSRRPRGAHEAGLSWPEELWVWFCVVGIVAGGEYPLLWLRVGTEPFSWALTVLCGTPALVGLVVWWCAVVAALIAWAPPQRERGARAVAGCSDDDTQSLPLLHRPSAAAPQAAPFSSTELTETGRPPRGYALLRRVSARLSPQHANLLVRKLFHAAAVVMFAPALAIQGGPAALALAFACAAKLLCTLELLRSLHARPRWLTVAVQRYVRGFTDARDAGPLVLTHIYLLLGCAGPLWVWLGGVGGGGGGSPGALAALAAAGAAPLAGVAVLGAGDAAAATVGIVASALGRAHSWGGALAALRRQRRRPPAASPPAWAGAGKTLEGSAAFVAATLLCLAGVDVLLQWQWQPPAAPGPDAAAWVGRWVRVAACATLASLLETFTLAIDNATLPAAFYVCVAW